MKKTLVLTVLSLSFLTGNIGTKSAQARNLTVSQALILKHKMLVSAHVRHWYHGRGHWTLHLQFNSCKAVRRKINQRQADICYKARVTLQRHTERYRRLHALLYPQPIYKIGGYNWNNMVSKCEAPGEGWYANTGNGFYFGPQFTRSTWHSSGGGPVREIDGYGPPMSSYSIPYIEHIAYNTIQQQGPGAWPNCHSYL